MPAGKYYCDYCEKEFQDTTAARKRHLQSKPHLRAKSLWFQSLSLQSQSQSHRLQPQLQPPYSSSSDRPGGEFRRVKDKGCCQVDLPPSLKPPPPEPDTSYLQLQQLHFVDWGWC